MTGKRILAVAALALSLSVPVILSAGSSAYGARRHGSPRHAVVHRAHARRRQWSTRDARQERRQRLLARRELRALSKLPHRVGGRAAMGRQASPRHGLALSGAEACPGEDLTPEAGDLEAVRSATVCLVNRERTDRGERPLTVNAKLQRAAQGHSENMVLDDYFSHYAPNGETPSQRMRQAGYLYSSRIGYEIGENIAWGTLYLATPKAIVQAWMESPGHRENILNGHYRETAIGVVAQVPDVFSEGQAGAIYTQDFGVIVAG
ncbi:MAG: CAP domain-containing protein [Solirubrobacteraceae bacterium]